MKSKSLKNMSFWITGLCLAMGFNSVAQADLSPGGLFIEPAVTYETSSSTTNWPSPPFGNSTGSADGVGLGARIGFHIYEAIFLGIDARYAKPQFKDSSTNYSASATSTNWGPVVGIQMPDIGLRVWGSYILGGELNPDGSGGYNFDYRNATGYRIGAGFHVLSVSLNLEYQQLKYGNTSIEQAGGANFSNLNSDSVNLKNNSWIASVSFPIEL